MFKGKLYKEEAAIIVALVCFFILMFILVSTRSNTIGLTCSGNKHVEVVSASYYDDGDFKHVNVKCVYNGEKTK